jgi:hypothetical protein
VAWQSPALPGPLALVPGLALLMLAMVLVLVLVLVLLAMVLRQVVAERQPWLPCSERVALAGAEEQELLGRSYELRAV